MIEVTIRTENEDALMKLLDFISTVGFQVSIKEDEKEREISGADFSETLPIEWAANPEKASEMFGIWKGQEMDLKKLRKAAWGDRL